MDMWLWGRRMGEGIVREFGIFKTDNQQELLYSTGSSAQCYVAAWMGEEFEGEWIHVYVIESLCCSPETVTSLLISSAAAAAKSLQLCLTLCDPIDGSPPGSSVPGILQARILGWVAISFSS